MCVLRILLLLLCCFAALQGQSQSPFDPINLGTPDLAKLNELTFQAVNNLRVERKTAPLVWDSVLFRAAQDHAHYLIQQSKLAHTQSSKEKNTPAQRVKVHGGLFFTRVGENLVGVVLGTNFSKQGRRLSTISLNATAQAMAQLWKLSPGHYKNILEPRFNVTAVATAYDKSSQRVVCVQVFGFTNITVAVEQADHSEKLLAMPRRKLPYRLKEARPDHKSNRSIRAFMKLKMDRGYLVGTFKTGKKAFKGRRSGFTQEFIHLSQFDSGAVEYNVVRNRRNGLFPLNGELAKPVSRAKMLKYSRENTTRKIWLKLGIIQIKQRTHTFIYPLYGAGPDFEFNLFLIRKRRLETFRSYSKIPGKSFTVPMPQLAMVNSFETIKSPPNTKNISTYDTLEVMAFFEEAKTELDPVVKNRLRSKLDSLDAKVISLETSAFASVDGNQEQNEILARQRLNNLMSALQPYLDTLSINPVVSTQEQWDLFYEQIKRHNLTHLMPLKKSALREYVNQNKKDSLISQLLSEQRYTLFKIVIRRDSMAVIPQPSLLAKYYQAKRRFDAKEKKSANDVAVLEKAQLAAYHQLIQTGSDTIPSIVVSDRYPVFQYHDLMFRYLVLENTSDGTLYNRFHQIGRSKYFPSRLRDQLLYNNLSLILRSYWHKDGISHMMDTKELYCKPYFNKEFFIRNYKKLKCRNYQEDHDSTYYVLKALPSFIAYGQKMKMNKFPADSLWKFYYLATINALSNEIPFPDEIYTLLPQIKKHFHPNESSLSVYQRVTLAFFYCQFFEYETAKRLLDPVVQELKDIPPGYKLYLSLQRDSFKEEHEFAEYLIRQFEIMGKTEWCSLWRESDYLNFLLLEDLKLKSFYNCNCGVEN
jgi:uncharacterized protein YkwD